MNVSFNAMVNKQVNVKDGLKVPTQPRGSNESYKLVGYGESKPESYESGVKPSEVFVYVNNKTQDIDLVVQPKVKGSNPFVFDAINKCFSTVFSVYENIGRASKTLGIKDDTRLGNDVNDLLKDVSQESNIKLSDDPKTKRLMEDIKKLIKVLSDSGEAIKGE